MSDDYRVPFCVVCGAPVPPNRRRYCCDEHIRAMSNHNLGAERKKHGYNYFTEEDPAPPRDQALDLQRSKLGGTARELRDDALRAAYGRVLQRHGLAS